MAHLRFTRDRRGYENTFLVHGDRAPGRDKPSVLYWFRTPPDVRIGRAPLDDEAIRALEKEHPDIRFDWPRLLEASAEAVARSGEAARPGSAGPQPAQPVRRHQRSRRRTAGHGRGSTESPPRTSD